MRILSLEYIRKILNSDFINFLADKKKTQFNLKNKVGPFICNHRDVEIKAAKQLLEYIFEEIFSWNYDPQGILSKMRVKCKLTSYIHEKKPEIEKYVNQTEWVEKILVDEVKQGDTSHTLQTSNQGEKATKRVREERTYIAENKTETRFKLRYSKKTKINSIDKGKVTIEVEDIDVPVTNTDAATINSNEPIIENLNEGNPDNSNTQVVEKQQNMEA